MQQKKALIKGKAAQELAEKRCGGADGCYSVVAHAVQECTGDEAGTLDRKCYEGSGGW